MNSEEAKAAVETADWKLGADDGDREMAMHGTLLLCIVGSTVHGLAVRDGVEDLDVMGICCEPPERVIGLMRFEQWVGRTKAMGERSEAGDVDAVVYSLRKWSRLALQGNPTCTPPALRSTGPCPGRNAAGHRAARDGRCLPIWPGRPPLPRLCDGPTGASRRHACSAWRVHRPELLELYGFDTKFAGHLLRLAYQGIEGLDDGTVSPSRPGSPRAHISVMSGPGACRCPRCSSRQKPQRHD